MSLRFRHIALGPVVACFAVVAALGAGAAAYAVNTDRVVAESFASALDQGPVTQATSSTTLISGTEDFWLNGRHGLTGKSVGSDVQPAAFAALPLTVAPGDRITVSTATGAHDFVVVGVKASQGALDIEARDSRLGANAPLVSFSATLPSPGKGRAGEAL